MAKVLVVDDKQMMRDSVCATLVRAGHQAVAAENGAVAIEMIGRHRPAAIVTDLKMPEVDGLDLLKRVGAIDPELPVILMTAFATVDTAVQAMKRGAFDYIQKPFEGDELVLCVDRAIEHRRLRTENAALRHAATGATSRQLIGQSPPMTALRKQIEQIAASHGSVLISGESGTGKEIVARMIHDLSPRHDQVMLCVNCAALSENLLESELFGHEKGAFTGADQLRKGRFELADGGTLLLDEVSEIDLPLQAKLLRVLQERQFERVGSSMTMDVDVRVMATTNRDLERAVAEGRFREDLYFRLNVLPIELPPLRHRQGDVALLAEHFLEEQARRDGRTVRRFTDDALELLCRYGFPGNVRELQNICERAGVLASGEAIDAAMIQPWLRPVARAEADQRSALSFENPPPLAEVERQVVVRTLDRFNGHRQRTAEALGIGVRTLGLKLRKWKEQDLVAKSI